MNVELALDSLELAVRLLSVLVIVATIATWAVGHAAAYWPTKHDRMLRRVVRGLLSLVLVLLGTVIAFLGGALQVAVLWTPVDGSLEKIVYAAMFAYPATALVNGVWTLILTHRLRKETAKPAEPDGPCVTLADSDGLLVSGLARSSALFWWTVFASLTVLASFVTLWKVTLPGDAGLGDAFVMMGAPIVALVVAGTLVACGYRAAPRARVCSAATRILIGTRARTNRGPFKRVRSKENRKGPIRGPEMLIRIREPRAPLPASADLARAIDRVRWGERSMAKADRLAVEWAARALAEKARDAAWRDNRALMRECARAACALHVSNAVAVYPALTAWFGDAHAQDADSRGGGARRFWEGLARGGMIAGLVVSIITLATHVNDIIEVLRDRLT